MSGVGLGGLWSYHAAHISPALCSLLLNVSLYPVGAWIFIQRYPRSLARRIAWYGLGDSILLLVEIALQTTHHMTYAHGWSLGWSAVANLALLALLRLHA